MNGVIGMTALLLGTELNKEQREYADTVRSSADSLLAIIDDILDHSKIEAGKLDLELIAFDLRIALEEVNDLLALKAQEKGLEYLYQIDSHVPSWVKGDPGRLRQILVNLVGNAVKFTEKGEVVIRVTLESETEANAILRFSVTDTGIGIPEIHKERLFKSFSQADESTTRLYGGTGLGLKISKELSELMGGDIGVESTPGEGSEFWFTVKLEKQVNAQHQPVLIPQDIRGKRILIVDDNATNRHILRDLLNSWNCQYDEVPGGIEAMDKLQSAVKHREPFDIALIDMQMPRMDGAILGEKIKQHPLIDRTILVMMTSMGDKGDAKRFLKIGFAGYLTKPVKPSQLFDTLCAVMGKHHQQATSDSLQIVNRHTLAEDRKRRIKILLVEDNVVNQRVATLQLEKLGYNVDIANNGYEAISALEKDSYNIVLMDCQMPELDGYAATAEIRSPNSKVVNHKIPIIAMTANAMEGDKEKCLNAGMDNYLTKPINPQDLADMLDKYLH